MMREKKVPVSDGRERKRRRTYVHTVLSVSFQGHSAMNDAVEDCMYVYVQYYQ